MDVPHKLGTEGALQRMKGFLTGKQIASPGKIKNLKENWDGNIGKFSFTAKEEMEVELSGKIVVEESNISLNLELPYAVKFLKGGEIKKGIEEEAATLLA